MMFKHMDFETISTCNRVCPTCIRNSHPDKGTIQHWHDTYYLDPSVVYEAIRQAQGMGFDGTVCLSHYNEPLMDWRISYIADYIKNTLKVSTVYLHTNGDYLTKELAEDLDGKLDKIVISLYTKKSERKERAEMFKSLFHKTEVQVITESDHIATHFSPKFPVAQLAETNRQHVCHEPSIRVIINHRKQYLACCDDVIGNFDMGTFPEISIKDFWFGYKREMMESNLSQEGGRANYPYCLSCPRN